jgi:hypothetical protein
MAWPYPEMTITAAEGATPLVTVDGATTTLALTFTSTETLTPAMVVGDLVLKNGALSSFAGSGTTYTATFTPTIRGRCVIYLPINTIAYGSVYFNPLAAGFQWDYDPPSLIGTQFEGNFSRSDPDVAKPIVLRGVQFEGNLPSTDPDANKPIVLRGVQFEGDFPPPGGGIEAGIFSNA